MNKEVRDVLEGYEAAGCKLVQGTKHVKVFGPDGRFLRAVGAGSHNPGYELVRRMRSEVRRMLEGDKT